MPSYGKGGLYINLFELYATLGLKDDGFSKSINDAKEKTGGLTGGIKNLIGTVAGIKVVSMAFDAVRNSMDAAFKRVDTMEQFQRTMTVLTGSSKATEKALDDVRRTVTGTAYGLDVAANAVQGFVTSGMDVGIATGHIEGLANAVSFYGDGTNATLQSVSDAWQNMATSGKVYSTDVRTLLNAGIPVWDIYAEAVGMSVEEVQAATSSGAIKAEEFQNTLVTALETGAGKFPSVTNAAQEAGASWQGTFDNMQAATTRGVTAIIAAIDGSLTGASLPSLREMLMSVGSGFESFLNAVAEAAGSLVESFAPAISLAISAFNLAIPILGNTVKILGALTPSIVAATAAYGAYKAIQTWTKTVDASKKAITLAQAATGGMTAVLGANTTAETLRTAAKAAGMTVDKAGNLITAEGTVATAAESAAVLASTGAISAKTLVVGVLSGTIGIATAAQIVWNAVMSMNPIGLLIAGVAALVAGIVVLIKWLNKESETSQKLNQENEKLADSTNKLTDSVTSSKEAYEDKTTSINAEIGASERLVGKVARLTLQESRSAEEKAKLNAYVNMLNDSMEGLNLEYDAETDSLNMSVDAILAKIRAYRKQAEAQAIQERINEVLKEQIQTEEQLNAIFEQRGNWAVAYENGEVKAKEYQNAVESLNEQEAELSTTNDELSTSYEYLEGRMIEGMEAAENETVNSIQTIAEAYDGLGETTKTAIDGILGTYETMTTSLSNLSKKIELDSKATWDSIVKNQEDTIAKTQEFSDLYAQLIQAGVSDSYLQAIGATGPESIPLLQGMLKAGTNEVLASQAEWESAYGMIGDTFIDSLGLDADATAAIKDYISGEAGIVGTLKSAIEEADLSGIGLNLTEGLSGGIEEGSEAVAQATSDMADSVIGAAEDGFKTHSPSVVFIEIGGNLMEGLAQGVSESFPQVNEIVNSKVNELVESAKKLMSQIPDKIYDSVLPANNKISEWGTKLIDIGKTKTTTFVETVKNIASNTPSEFYDAVKPTINRVQSWIDDLITKVKRDIPQFVTAAKDTVNPIVGEMKTIGENIVAGLWQGIESKSGWFYKNLSNFTSRIVKQVKSELQISSPSKVFSEIGMFTASGFIVGLQSMSTNVERAIDNVFGIDSLLTPDYQTGFSGQLALADATLTSNNQITHSGEITIRGVNDQNEFIASSKLLLKQMMDELMRDARRLR